MYIKKMSEKLFKPRKIYFYFCRKTFKRLQNLFILFLNACPAQTP